MTKFLGVMFQEKKVFFKVRFSKNKGLWNQNKEKWKVDFPGRFQKELIKYTEDENNHY